MCRVLLDDGGPVICPGTDFLGFYHPAGGRFLLHDVAHNGVFCFTYSMERSKIPVSSSAAPDTAYPVWDFHSRDRYSGRMGSNLGKSMGAGVSVDDEMVLDNHVLDSRGGNGFCLWL